MLRLKVTYCLFQLYFDLEFRKADQVSKINGDLMLTKFKEFLETDLCKVSFAQLVDKIEIIDLDSSTQEKFSHHLIVNMYHENDPVLFPDNLQGIQFKRGYFPYSQKYVPSLVLKNL